MNVINAGEGSRTTPQTSASSISLPSPGETPTVRKTKPQVDPATQPFRVLSLPALLDAEEPPRIVDH